MHEVTEPTVKSVYVYAVAQLVRKYPVLKLEVELRVLLLHVSKALVGRPTVQLTIHAAFVPVVSQLRQLIHVMEMELVKLPAKLVNAWGVVEQQSTVVTTLVMMMCGYTAMDGVARGGDGDNGESGSRDSDHAVVGWLKTRSQIGEVASSPGLFGNSVMYVNSV
ncbi:hypothetical protein PC122_g9053 [Phytophthora cactorum]|nr:hypothetical protein PC122_g9053 [Phytophthora cactorum]